VKPLYDVILVVGALIISVVPALAQTPPLTPPATSSARPFEILDNSFLVEEAFNQEANIFQNIFGYQRVTGRWAFGFTQEWPVGGQRHQFSYTVPFVQSGNGAGVGDMAINYRLQVSAGSPSRPAFSPRVSVLLPSGSSTAGRGSGTSGLQINLPFSQQAQDVFVHWNAGITWLPSVEPPGVTDGVTLTSPFLAASVIWRARPMVHPMFETVAVWEHVAGPTGTLRQRALTISPGVRFGWNLGDRQFVAGVAFPITFLGGANEPGGFLYMSYELPFRR
jgi:hypothetical protein